MPIRTGVGIGEAQVYSQPSELVNTYGKIMVQQAKDRAKFEEDLATTMAKYSTKGLKDGDIKLTTEAYKNLKDKVTKYDSRNPTQRAQALAEARAGMQSIQDYADGAMTAYSNLDKISGDILENPWKYKPESVAAVKQLYANPYATWSDDYKDLNRAKFEREPDGSSVQKLFNVVNADLKAQAEAGNQFNVGQKGGYKIATYFATPEQASQTILKTMDLAPESKYTLTKAYESANPDKKDYTQLDVANFATQLYKDQFGPNALSFKGNMSLIPKTTGGSGEGEDKLTYRQKLITGLINQDEDYRQELQANLPANSKIDYGISRAVPGVSKGGYKYIKIRIPAESTENGIEVVETIPLEAGKPIQKLNYIINQYSPEKVSPSKVGITGGKPRGDKFEVGQQPAAKKEIKQSDIKAKAIAAGYSVSEYTKLLQKNGIKIIK